MMGFKTAATAAGFAFAAVAALLTPADAEAAPGWVCSVLDQSPNMDGLGTVIERLVVQGYTADNGGPEFLVGTVLVQCPEHLVTLQELVDATNA